MFSRQFSPASLAACALLLSSSFACAQTAPSIRPPEVASATGAAIRSDIAVARTYYVSPQGSDQNPGSSASPWRTMKHAVTQAFARQNEGVSCKVVFRRGVYREQIGEFVAPTDAIQLENVRKTPVVFQGEAPDAVVLDGSDVLSGWKTENGAYFVPWTHNWGRQRWRYGNALPHQEAKFYGSPVPDILRRKEAVFFDDLLLRQVLSAQELAPGHFFVDEAQDRLWMQPPAGRTLNARTQISAAMRDVMWRIERRHNLVLSNLVFRRAGNYYSGGQSPLRVLRSDNVLIERCRFVQNNDTGLYLGKRGIGVTVRDCDFSENGEVGFQPDALTNLLVEDCRFNSNNWRGAWGNYLTWSPTGFKCMFARGATFRRNVARDNKSVGMWIDVDNTDILLEDNISSNNLEQGFYLEYSQGPMLLRRNTASENGKDGFILDVVTHVTLEKNIAWNNGRYAFNVRDKVSRSTDTIRDTTEKLTLSVDHITLRDNLFVNTRPKGLLLNLVPSTFNRGKFTETFVADRNLYFAPQAERPFQIGKETFDFKGYQNAIQREGESRFADPRFAAPEQGDFRLRPNTAALNRDLPALAR